VLVYIQHLKYKKAYSYSSVFQHFSLLFNNYQYNYTYYAIFNIRGGFVQGLTGILRKDVIPMKIDFDMDPFDKFVFSIRYSANKDPSL